jgi:hypothetical protein
MKRLAALLFLAAINTSIAYADDSDHMANENEAHAGAEHGKNHIAAIIGYGQKSGATDGPTGGKQALIYGIEYQYRVHDRLSLGVFYEQSSGDFDAESFGIPAWVSLTDQLKLLLAVGSERKLFEEDDEVLYRVGLGYDIEFENVTVAPAGWVDFVNGKEIYFLGFTIGTGF